MSSGGLGNLVVLSWLDRMYQVGELDRILDEKHRDIVADDVEVALIGVSVKGSALHQHSEEQRQL